MKITKEVASLIDSKKCVPFHNETDLYSAVEWKYNIQDIKSKKNIYIY